MTNRTLLRAACAALSIAILSGCRSDPLTVRTFVLALPRPAADGAADPALARPSLGLERIRVNPVVNQDRIQVRGGPGGREIRWLEDGGARWVLLPGDMVFEAVARELRAGDRYGSVLVAGMRSADWVLRLELADLAVLVDENNEARAACEIQAMLLRHVQDALPGKDTELVWSGRRAGSAPLADRSADGAVTALCGALEQALRPPDGVLAEIYSRTVGAGAPAGPAAREASEQARQAAEPPAQALR